MGMLGQLIGAGIGGSVGLVVVAALLPTADTNIAANTLNNSSADTLWQLLPLFLVIAIAMVLLGGFIGGKI